MKKVKHSHRKPAGGKPVKTSDYFSAKKPRMGENHTFSGKSKTHR